MISQAGYKYLYHQRNETENKSMWRCKRYTGSKTFPKCPARAWTIGTNITKFINQHNHEPNNADFEGIELTPHGNDALDFKENSTEPIGHFVDVD